MKKALAEAIASLKEYGAHSVGIGFKYTKRARTTKVAIVFYVHRKHKPDELGRLGLKLIPSAINGVPTDVREVPGGFTKRDSKPVATQGKFRPFQGGVTGISAKELNAAATLGYVSRAGEVLSNNHVLADEDLTVRHTASKGDRFLQPSYLDGGTDPADEVGSLDRWVSLQPTTGTGVNYIDGAVGVADAGLSSPGVYGIGEASGFAQPSLGMAVQKVGRTTGHTKGVITAVGVSTDVGGYQGTFTCAFADQIQVEGEGGEDFSAPGDSGSAIVTQPGAGGEIAYVALLFAGGADSDGRDITIGCPSNYVESLLSFQIP